MRTRTCSNYSSACVHRCQVTSIMFDYLQRIKPSLPGSSVHWIPQARILEWAAMPSPRGSSQLRNWTPVSYVSCIGRWVLYHQCHLGSTSLALSFLLEPQTRWPRCDFSSPEIPKKSRDTHLHAPRPLFPILGAPGWSAHYTSDTWLKSAICSLSFPMHPSCCWFTAQSGSTAKSGNQEVIAWYRMNPQSWQPRLQNSIPMPSMPFTTRKIIV